MKKFFMDVIGEIKSPSEDAGKVLSVIRQIIRFTLILAIISNLIGIVYFVYNMSISPLSFQEMMGINYGIEGFFRMGFRYFEDIIMLFLFLCLFFEVNKSVKRNESIDSSLFKTALIILSLLPLATRILSQSSILFCITTFVTSVSFAGIIAVTFMAFSKKKSASEMSEDNLIIRNISIFSYAYLIAFITPMFISFLRSIKYADHFISGFMKYNSDMTLLDKIFYLSSNSYYLLLLILLVLIALVIISRINFSSLTKKAINIFLLIYIVISLFLFITIGMGHGFMVAIVLVISTGYQNKYKVFDKLGNRILKTSAEKIKTGFNNYLNLDK